MSRWQFRNSDFYGGFKKKWESHLTGVQMVDSRLERVEFPSIKYGKQQEPSAWAQNDWALIYKCTLRKCVIPVSVLSIMEDCSFVDCRFVDDPTPVTFKTVVKRTVNESKCSWKIRNMPENLVITEVPFRP